MKFILITLFVSFSLFSNAQSSDSVHHYSLGIRLKKYVGFYWVNGMTAEWHSTNLLNNKLYLGMNIASSKLGSALNTNALTTWEAEIYSMYLFRPLKPFNPLIKLNIGIANAQLETSYASIPSRSLLLSIETGFNYLYRNNVVRFMGGYNLITGNGLSGLGTIYPIYTGICLMRSFN